jgi:hypothetical protein
MGILLICIIIFILIFPSGYAGLHMQKRLADEHKTLESRSVVGQMSGLLTLLLALVLGTLIGVSFAYYSTQKTELEGFSAQILRLDQALAQYGPETKPPRNKLKAGIVKGYETFWGGGDVDSNALTVATPLANSQAMSDFLGTLQPKTNAQKEALATANQYNSMVEQSRLLMSLQVASPPVSWVIIAILVFWTLALSFGIGLFAQEGPSLRESNPVSAGGLTRRPASPRHYRSETCHSFPMTASTCSSGVEEARKMPEYGFLKSSIR